MSDTDFQRDAVCPFCGLFCDDVSVRAEGAAIQVLKRGCERSRESYARIPPEAGPARIRGVPASLDEAASAAAAILARSCQPLIAGLATDVAGMRAVMELAERCGAILDHMNAEAKFRNLLALQDGGWITTTLAEVRHRADLIVLAGTDVVSRFPRFFERFVWSGESMFGLDPASRRIVYLGRGLDMGAGVAPDGRRPLGIPCEIPRLGEAFAVLRALLAGRPLRATHAAGIPVETWRSLADTMAGARYGVVVWAAPDLDFPHADLTVRSLAELLKDLNRSTRFSGLPLGGSEGDFTADAVELWQTGLPFRSRLGRDGPAYDPHLYRTERLLKSGEVDALVWIASIDSRRVPPETDVPTVVLGAAGMQLAREPEVFIPVGTPAVDHAAHLFRTDKVVALHARALRPAGGPPSVARAVGAIDAAMKADAPC